MYTISQAVNATHIHFPIFDKISPGLSVDLLNIKTLLENNDYVLPKNQMTLLKQVVQKLDRLFNTLTRDYNPHFNPEIFMAYVTVSSAVKNLKRETDEAIAAKEALKQPVTPLTKTALTPENCAKFTSGMALVRAVYAQYRHFYSKAEVEDIEKCFNSFFGAAEIILSKFDQLKVQLNINFQVTATSSSSQVPAEFTEDYYKLLEAEKESLAKTTAETEKKIQAQLEHDFIQKNLELLTSIEDYLLEFHAAVASRKLFSFFNAHFSPTSNARKNLAATVAKLKQDNTTILTDLANRIVNSRSFTLDETQENQLLGLLCQIRAFIPKEHADNNHLIFILLERKLLSFLEGRQKLSATTRHELWKKISTIDDNYSLFQEPWREYKADVAIDAETVAQCHAAVFNNLEEKKRIEDALLDFLSRHTLDETFTPFLFLKSAKNFLWQSYKRDDIATFGKTLRVFPKSVYTLTRDQMGQILESPNREWQQVFFNNLICHPFALWQAILSGATDEQIVTATKDFPNSMATTRHYQEQMWINIRELSRIPNNRSDQVALNIQQNLSKEYLALLKTAIEFLVEMDRFEQRRLWTYTLAMISALILSPASIAVSFFAIIQYADLDTMTKVVLCFPPVFGAGAVYAIAFTLVSALGNAFVHAQFEQMKKDFILALCALKSSLETSDANGLSRIMTVWEADTRNTPLPLPERMPGSEHDMLHVDIRWQDYKNTLDTICALITTLARHPEIKKAMEAQAANNTPLTATQSYLWKSWRSQDKIASSDVQPEETSHLLASQNKLNYNGSKGGR